MAIVGLRNVVDLLRRGCSESVPDGDLLDRFVTHRDEAAFAELVVRHGPKVYAVCRRVLGRDQLAEDAYQATFVVLAKKAHISSGAGRLLYTRIPWPPWRRAGPIPLRGCDPHMSPERSTRRTGSPATSVYLGDRFGPSPPRP